MHPREPSDLVWEYKPMTAAPGVALLTAKDTLTCLYFLLKTICRLVRFSCRHRKLSLACVLLAAVLLFALTWRTLPPSGELIHLNGRVAFVVESDGAGGVTRADTKGSRPVDAKELPEDLTKLLLFREDRRFFEHLGICYRGVARALWVLVTKGRCEGASGITQQAAKNAWLGQQRTLWRKWKEAVFALKLTHELEKEQILALHLNTAPLGGGLYGVETAARAYFQKTTAELNLFECALIVEMLRAPTAANFRINRAEAERRARRLLNAAADAGVLPAQEVTTAMRVGVQKGGRAVPDAEFRWVFDYIKPELKSSLRGRRGRYIVVTTVSAESQIYAQHAVTSALDHADQAHNAQAAVVSLGSDGAILAMVGGRDYAKVQFNHAVDAWRQPGSLFKLFVYLAALEQGRKLDTAIMDTPTAGWPKNFDGRYRGRVTLTEAFTHSLNAATVNLAREVGFDNVIAVANRFGIAMAAEEREAQMLGTSETTLLAMTSAYATVGVGGLRVEPYAILLIRDLNGNVLYRHPVPEHRQVLQPQIAESMNHLLRQVVTNGTGRAAAVPNVLVSGKTGTTRQDAWFIAFTPEICTGVWLGTPDNVPLDGINGGGLPARVYRECTAYIYKFQDVDALRQPLLASYPQRTTFAEQFANAKLYVVSTVGEIGARIKEKSPEAIEYSMPKTRATRLKLDNAPALLELMRVQLGAIVQYVLTLAGAGDDTKNA